MTTTVYALAFSCLTLTLNALPSNSPDHTTEAISKGATAAEVTNPLDQTTSGGRWLSYVASEVDSAGVDTLQAPPRVRRPGLRLSLGLAGIIALTPEYGSDLSLGYNTSILIPVAGPVDMFVRGGYFEIGERYGRPWSSSVPNSKWLTGLLGIKLFTGSHERGSSTDFSIFRRGITISAGMGITRVNHTTKYYESPSSWPVNTYIPQESMIEHDINFSQNALLYHIGLGLQFLDRLSLTADFNITDHVITLPITTVRNTWWNQQPIAPRSEWLGSLCLDYTFGRVR